MLDSIDQVFGPEECSKIRSSYKEFCRLYSGEKDSLWDQFIESLVEQQKCSQEIIQHLRDMVEVDFTLVHGDNNDSAVTAQTSKENELQSSVIIPGHSLIKSIGSGAMGEVYLAKDTALKRRVALKRLKAEKVPQNVAERFLVEAQITAQLDHPNIIPVYGLESTGDKTLAYTMKLIKGHELEKIIAEAREAYEEGSKPSDDASFSMRLEHFLKVCDALEFAHRRGVLHRDLKPANIMVGEFHEVYVMDWGIAKLHGDEALKTLQADRSADQANAEDKPHLTMKNALAGTPLYMSPEQAKGIDELDHRSDIYTLGLILFELAYLKRARSGSNIMAALTNAAQGKLAPFEHVCPKVKVPRELAGIIRKATALDPAERYQHVRELSADLRRFLRGDEVRAVPDNIFRRVARLIGKHRQATLLLIFGLAFLSAASIAWTLYQQQKSFIHKTLYQEKLNQFLGAMQEQGNDLENDLIFYENRLRLTAAEVTMLLEYGKTNTERAYRVEDLVLGSNPPDYQFSSAYNQPVSMEWPVAYLPPTADKTTAAAQLSVVTPIRSSFKRMFTDKMVDASVPLFDDGRAGVSAAENSSPVLWSTLGLESGLAVVYPGRGNFPMGYDPRIRPWYQLAIQKKAVSWGVPHADLTGLGLVLPCAVPLIASSGKFLGAIAIDIKFEHLFKLLGADLPGTRHEYLVDAEGNIIVSSNENIARYRDASPNEVLHLDRFPYRDQWSEISQSQQVFGVINFEESGTTHWMGFLKLESLGWSYIVTLPVSE